MKKLRIHCFQQVAVEGLGCIADWIADKNYDITYTRFYEKVILPQVDDFDWLIVMGGPMSVYEDDIYPWLADEKRLIKEAIAKDKVVLGICLGSQFIAAALCAAVYPGRNKEIGWHSLQLTELGKTSMLAGVEGESVFHWHGDTFDVPQGATLLASSEATPHQAFVYHEKVLALQFHLEVKEQSVDEMVGAFPDHLMPEKYVQSAESILARKSIIARNNQLMFSVLDALDLA